MVTEIVRPEVCVIGAGPGALRIATAAAARGLPVVLVEKDWPGGTGFDGGALASTALRAAAEASRIVRQARTFGIAVQKPEVDLAKVREHVRGVVRAAAPDHAKARFVGLGVRVIEGGARFTARDTVVAGEVEIKARHFVIASGSRLAMPAVGGLQETPYLTPETVFDLQLCPEHLLVVGAGATGVALAQCFRRLGSQVTILEAAAPLQGADSECAAILLDALAREGITIRSAVTLGRIEANGAKVRALLQRADGEDAVDGSHLLFATGRQPNIDALDLAAGGIGTEKRGIVTDSGLRTSNRRVFAIGGATAAPSSHASDHHAEVVIRQIVFQARAEVSDGAVPRIVSTDPGLAEVGLNEEEARQQHGGIRVLRSGFFDNARAQAERQTRGHIKVLAAADGRVLGAAIVGHDAAEMIAMWTLAVRQGLNIAALADLAVPCPSYAETSIQAAQGLPPPAATSSWLRRFIASWRRAG
jgi:pyruvate/2-oxoglutarate dehydrogenase complex dihydrolipoamide dehydrogenase (E3) component